MVRNKWQLEKKDLKCHKILYFLILPYKKLYLATLFF